MKVNLYLNDHLHNWIVPFTESAKKDIGLSPFYFLFESFIFNYVNDWELSNSFKIAIQFKWEIRLRLNVKNILKYIFSAAFGKYTRNVFSAFLKTQILRARMDFTDWLFQRIILWIPRIPCIFKTWIYTRIYQILQSSGKVFIL